MVAMCLLTIGSSTSAHRVSAGCSGKFNAVEHGEGFAVTAEADHAGREAACF
jgi:hypothetical protein